MGRPCKHHTNLDPGKPYVMGTCRFCWLFFNSAKHRKLWGEEEGVAALPASAGPVTFRKPCNCNANKAPAKA